MRYLLDPAPDGLLAPPPERLEGRSLSCLDTLRLSHKKRVCFYACAQRTHPRTWKSRNRFGRLSHRAYGSALSCGNAVVKPGTAPAHGIPAARRRDRRCGGRTGARAARGRPDRRPGAGRRRRWRTRPDRAPAGPSRAGRMHQVRGRRSRGSSPGGAGSSSASAG
jgi:hypothetical protein